MLVLSRREHEKILFPKLGISVEVVQTKANSVRLGIEAPVNVRVIRNELANKDGAWEQVDQKRGSRNAKNSYRTSSDSTGEIQKNLEGIRVAIHLTQNQLKQGLSGQADETLEQVLRNLNALEDAVCAEGHLAPADSLVRESTSRYEVGRQRSADLFPKPADAMGLGEGILVERNYLALTS